MTAPAKRNPIPFGKYLLLDRINIGGMAEVWRGKMFGAGGFERLVAIKRILPNIAEDEEFITMFIDEAKITVQLNHANVAQVYELGNIANNYFIAMEYIAGKDMRAIFDRCRKKGEPAPIPLTCYSVAKMCEGLDYAHRKKDTMGREMNIVHRDISPQNVLVSYEGEIKVIDFGIAKAAGKATKTQAGILKGKFAYMSPEQIRGLPLDRRSDVFAIGVCLYEMLTGERLFVGDSDFSVLEKVRKAEVLPPSTFNRRIPEGLEKIVLKALAKDVEDRYQYASDLADDLQKFLITSDSIFSRKDLMQYMKSTFAEDVEREKLRLQEYAEVKPTEGMMAALEMGIGGAPVAAVAPPSGPVPSPIQLTATAAAPARTSVPGMPVVQPSGQRASSTGLPAIQPNAPRTSAPALTPVGPPTLGPAAPMAGSVGNSPTNVGTAPTQAGAPRRSPSLASMPAPKLTAAAPAATPADDEGGATMLVDGREYFNEKGEPITNPAMASPALTAAPPAAFRPDLNPGTAVVGPPQSLSAAETDEMMNAATQYTPQDAPAPAPIPAATQPYVRPGLRQTGPLPIPPNMGQPAKPSRAMPVPPMMGRAAPAPAMEEEEDTQGAATSPHRPSLAHAEREAATDAMATPLGGSKFKIIGAVAAALVMVLAGVAFVVFRGPAMGSLYIKLPKEVAAKGRVSFNGKDLPAEKVRLAELLEPMESGPVAVMIQADGWDTFAGTIEVKPGNEVTRFEPQMKKLVVNAQLILIFQPEDAEVRVNGSVVKKAGVKSGPYIGEVPAGSESTIEVRAAGYSPSSQKISPDGSSPTTLNVKLTALTFPLTVSSDPQGAHVYANGRDMGETPVNLSVNGDTTSLTFKKKCFNDVEVPLNLPAQPPSSPQAVSAKLVKQPNCR